MSRTRIARLRSRAREQAVSSQIPFGFLKEETRSADLGGPTDPGFSARATRPPDPRPSALTVPAPPVSH